MGSTAYGLARPGSDVDQLGVFIAPTEAVLGLSGRSVVDSSHVTHEPDLTLHEVGKYLRLAVKGNPTVLELLFAPEYVVCTEPGRALVGLRSAVLSTPAVRNAYGGYARQQAERLQRRHAGGQEGFSSDVRGRTEKHGRHCMRLMLMGEELLATGELTLDVSGHREELFAAGELAGSDPVAFAALFAERDERLQQVSSVLPDHPDLEAVNATLVEIRLGALSR